MTPKQKRDHKHANAIRAAITRAQAEVAKMGVVAEHCWQLTWPERFKVFFTGKIWARDDGSRVALSVGTLVKKEQRPEPPTKGTP